MLMMAAGSVLYAIGFAMYGFVSLYSLFLLAMVVITLFQMGAAPVRPDELTIGSPLLLPTQTPTATLRV